MNQQILLGHGDGGTLSSDLTTGLFLKYFDSKELAKLTDSAVLEFDHSQLAFTTDSYVVDPIFFPGGDIGKMAVCGTVNDLSVSGATPLYMSAGFIIEEGFALELLENIVQSMAREARYAGVHIVCGDTKVVNKGKCDKIFINTSGIGVIDKKHLNISSGKDIRSGDKIIINGFVGDHGISVLGAREGISFSNSVITDCASLNKLISGILAVSDNIHFMRDATRGGLATVLCEMANRGDFGIVVNEQSIPVRQETKGVCELLGFDPVYLANEGKVVIVVKNEDAQKVLSTLRNHPYGVNSEIIGEIVDHNPGKVILHTLIGGNRFVAKLSGEQIPRIC